MYFFGGSEMSWMLFRYIIDVMQRIKSILICNYSPFFPAAFTLPAKANKVPKIITLVVHSILAHVSFPTEPPSSEMTPKLRQGKLSDAGLNFYPAWLAADFLIELLTHFHIWDIPIFYPLWSNFSNALEI